MWLSHTYGGLSELPPPPPKPLWICPCQAVRKKCTAAMLAVAPDVSCTVPVCLLPRQFWTPSSGKNFSCIFFSKIVFFELVRWLTNIKQNIASKTRGSYHRPLSVCYRRFLTSYGKCSPSLARLIIYFKTKGDFLLTFKEWNLPATPFSSWSWIKMFWQKLKYSGVRF